MNRILHIALLVAAYCAIATPAAADPITIIVTAITLVAEVGSIGGILIAAAVSVGLQLLSSALAPSQKQAAADQQFGIKTALQQGGTVPRSFIFGTYMTPGSEYHPARTWGEDGKTENAYLTRFIALSDLPSSRLAYLYVDDKPCTYGSGTADANLGYAIPEYNKDGKDHLWVKFYDGTQYAADPYFASLLAGDPDYPYTLDMIGKGITYVIVTALFEQTLFPSIPQYRWVLDGAKFYDPRKDSSVGGSGSQRFDTPLSWEFTKNPAVIKYNILRGIAYEGDWLFGLQNTAAGRLPLDNWFAAMNVCDTSVQYRFGVYRPQFECGGEIALDSQPADALEQLNKADNGRLIETGGIFKTRSGPVGAAVMSFTDADLIITEGQSFDPFPGLEEAINGVDATYPEVLQNWTMTDAPSLYSDTLEAADGGRRLVASIRYNFVPDGDQVQFLMKSARDEGRKFRKHSVTAAPRAAQLDGLDVIAWTSARNGYTNKLFTAIPTDNPNLDQALVLVEVDPADYDWDPATDFKTYTPIPIVGQPVPAQVMTGFAVSGIALQGGDGRKVAAIQLTWGTSGIYAVDGVQYEVRLDSDPATVVLAGETDSFVNASAYISQNIVGATTYNVRARYRPINGAQDSTWSSWLTVTTPDVKIISSELADALITFGKFAAGITPVQQVDDLADAIVGEGNLAVLTTDKKVYKDVDGTGDWQLLVQINPDDFADYSIPGSKVAIVDVTNICTNPQFVDGAGAPSNDGWTLNYADAGTSFAANGWPNRYVGDSNSRDNTFGAFFPVTEGQVFAFDAVIQNASGHDGSIGMTFKTPTGTQTWVAAITEASSGSGPHHVSGQLTVPAGYTMGQIWIQQNASSSFGHFYFTKLLVRKAASAELLVDGSITAQKVGANEITAGLLAVGAVNASDILVDNLIVTGHLVTNAVTDSIASSTGSQSMGTFPTPAAVTGGSGSITFGAANQPVFYSLSATVSTAGRQRTSSVTLKRNGTIVGSASSVPLTGTCSISFVGFDASNVAGSNTYELVVDQDDPTGSGVPGTCVSATLFVAYWKR